MNIKKFSPWNWLSKDENNIPVLSQPDRSNDHPVDMLKLQDVMEHTLTNVLRNFGFQLSLEWPDTKQPLFLRPHLDEVSGEHEYLITVEVPGVDEKDIKLEMAGDGALIICGEKRQELENKGRNIHRIERAYGAFRRVLPLPDDADRDALDAYFRNGVLTITCPRLAPAALAPVKQIEIKKVA